MRFLKKKSYRYYFKQSSENTFREFYKNSLENFQKVSSEILPAILPETSPEVNLEIYSGIPSANHTCITSRSPPGMPSGFYWRFSQEFLKKFYLRFLRKILLDFSSVKSYLIAFSNSNNTSSIDSR